MDTISYSKNHNNLNIPYPHPNQTFIKQLRLATFSKINRKKQWNIEIYNIFHKNITASHLTFNR